MLLVGAVAGGYRATQGLLLLLQRRNVLALDMLLLMLMRFPTLMPYARVTRTGACGNEAKAKGSRKVTDAGSYMDMDEA